MEEFDLGSNTFQPGEVDDFEQFGGNEDENPLPEPTKKKQRTVQSSFDVLEGKESQVGEEDEEEDKRKEGKEENAIVPVIPEDPYLKRKLQVIIRAYRTRFAHRLDGITFDGLDTMSIEELQKVVDEIRFIMGCSAPGTVTKLMVKAGISLWETGLVNVFHLPAVGINARLEKNPAFHELMDEVQLEYAEMFSQSATSRLGILLATTTYEVIQMNKLTSVSQCFDRDQIPRQLQEKWNFL